MHHQLAAFGRDILVAPLVHHCLAVEALVALSAEAPYPVLANPAQSRAGESFRLVLVSIDQIDFAPSPGASPINAAVLACALYAWPLRHIGKHMQHEFALLVHIVQADGFVQLDLTAQCARIAFLVHPFQRERLRLVKFADFADFFVEIGQLDKAGAARLLEINNRDEARIENVYFHVVHVAVEFVYQMHVGRGVQVAV